MLLPGEIIQCKHKLNAVFKDKRIETVPGQFLTVDGVYVEDENLEEIGNIFYSFKEIATENQVAYFRADHRFISIRDISISEIKNYKP